jgi:hypothetical protein
MPLDRSHAETLLTRPAVGSNLARYWAGVRNCRYCALPGVDTAVTAALTTPSPPRGARYTRTVTDDWAAGRPTDAFRAQLGALFLSSDRGAVRAPSATELAPAASTHTPRAVNPSGFNHRTDIESPLNDDEPAQGRSRARELYVRSA